MVVLSFIGLFFGIVPFGYLFLLALASIWTLPVVKLLPEFRFNIVIAAHDEESVIVNTIRRLRELDYPSQFYSIHIVADHCSDATAELARDAGAVVHERNDGPRNGKGAALAWLFQRILQNQECDAIVIFDADTRVASNFLQIMNARLKLGDQIIQGRHVISNPESGWFPALTWAMFIIDNRFQNLGRVNLGWSAKNMGDSICIRTDVLRKVGWGDGLADDYQLRQIFLLNGIRIAYEPMAVGLGEAPLSWQQARTQRIRWIRGVDDAGQQFAWKLLVQGIKTRDMAMLDGALQSYLPSYSVLTVIFAMTLLLHVIGYQYFGALGAPLLTIWSICVGLLVLYPLLGLALEHAPLKAYLVILTGPFYMIWKIWLIMLSRFGKRNITWVRTKHKG